MFKNFLFNTLVSLLAYGAISVIGLIIVPVLVSAYGLPLYGLIVAARLWMPSGILGMLDLGVGEAATLSVARARSTHEFEWAGGRIVWLGGLALAIGVVCGAALLGAGETVTRSQGVPKEYQRVFLSILTFSALAMPLMFVSLVAEGVVKGFENYSAMRAIEVMSAFAYGLGSLIVVWLDREFSDIAYLFVAISTLRAITSVVIAICILNRASLSIWRWNPSGLADCWRQMRLLAVNKVLSTLQTQTAPMLVVMLVGPAGLAIYDVLVRLPRFAKSILGLINSALMPFAARLDAARQTDDLKRLGTIGLPMVAAITMPPLFAAATFSEPILRLWIGPDVVGYWHWQSLMFVVPAMSVLVSFGGTALATHHSVPGRMNRLLAVQLCLQILVAVALAEHLRERAFVIGQVMGACTTFYWQLRIIFLAQELGAETARRLGVVVVVGLLLSMFILPIAGGIQSLWVLVTAIGGYSMFHWGVNGFLLIDKLSWHRIWRQFVQGRGR